MKNISSSIGIFAFLALTLSLCCYGAEDECSSIKYTKHDLSEKPELLVLKKDIVPDRKSHKIRICFIGKEHSENSLSFDFDAFSGYKQFEYDSETWSIYSLTDKFDLKRSQIYNRFIKSNDLHVLNLESKEHKIIYSFNSHESNKTIHSMALDWVTKNVYFTDDQALSVLNVKDITKPPKALYAFKENTFWADVKVFPNHGYLILITSPQMIMRLDLDGSNPTEFHVGNVTPNIVVDHHEQELWWNEFTNKSIKILHKNINGGDVKNFEIVNCPLNHTMSYIVSLDEKYVYFVPVNVTSNKPDILLLRARKTDGSFDSDFNLATDDISSGVPLHIFVLDEQSQKITKNHPCLIDDNGCHSFCTAIPDKHKKLIEKCV